MFGSVDDGALWKHGIRQAWQLFRLAMGYHFPGEVERRAEDMLTDVFVGGIVLCSRSVLFHTVTR